MRRLLPVFILGVLVTAPPAHAQLVGTDTAPGSSCAGFPDGATRMTADADLDGAQVVLVCDGTTWLPMAGGSGTPAGANTQIQFNSSGAFGATSGLAWNIGSTRLDVTGDLDVLTGNLDINNTGPNIDLQDSDAPNASSGGNQGSSIVFRDGINQVAGRLGYLNTSYMILQNSVQGGSLRLNAADDVIFFASATERMRLTDAGYLGIGTTSPVVALDVIGDINYTGVIVDVSDIRMKYDIRPLDRPLDKLAALNGFSFKMLGDRTQSVEYGVSAQDVLRTAVEN